MTMETLRALTELKCPKCKSPETRLDGELNIRAYKVERNGIWHSQCLVCSGYYHGGHDPKKGWFGEDEL